MKLAIIMGVLFSLSAHAVDEEMIRASVLKNFPLIEEARLKHRASGATVTGAEGAFDYKLNARSRNMIEDKYENHFFEISLQRQTSFYGTSLIAGHRQGRGLFPPYDGKLETSGGGELFAGISLPLLRDFSTDEGRTNLAVRKLEVKQAAEQLRLKRNMYVHTAISLFYKWRLEHKKVMIYQEILGLAEGRSSMIERKFRSGDIERLKVTDNERSIQKRRDELLKAQTRLLEFRNELSLFAPDLTLEGPAERTEVSTESPNLSKELEVENVPAVRILSLEREKQLLFQKLAEQERLPSLGVDLLGTREVSSNDPFDDESLQVGIKFQYPLENRKARGKTVEETYKRRAVEKQIDYNRTELARSYDYVVRALELGRTRFSNLREEEKNTQQMASAEKRRWEQGSSDLYIVNLREEDVANVEIRKWQAYYEIRQFLVDARWLRAELAD